MISLYEYSGQGPMSFKGLSIDEKPTIEYDGCKILNGSSFFEIDTQNICFYDGVTQEWLDEGSYNVRLQTKNATPSTSQQIIEPDTGYNGISKVILSGVTNDIDSNIVAENIKSGITILGVEGTLDPSAEPVLQNKTVTPTTSQQVISADNGYDGLDEVTVNGVDNSIDSNIVAGNIKSGVTILGVQGSYDPQPTLQSVNITPTTSSQTITPPSGVDGYNEITVDAIALQNKTVSPSTSQQVISCESNYNGLDEVTIEAVDSTIDSDIIASNIKNGVDILGVTGTLVPEEKYVLDEDTLATLPSSDKSRCVFVYNGKLQLIDRTGHYEYDESTNSWTTIKTDSSIIDREKNGQHNCGWLFGDKVVFLTVLGLDDNLYAKIREYDLTDNTYSDRQGGTYNNAQYPSCAIEYKGDLYASYGYNGTKIAKINMNDLTYTVQCDTDRLYNQLVFYKDELYGISEIISSKCYFDKIDLTDGSVTNIAEFDQDGITLLATSDYIFVIGVTSSYNKIYKYDGTDYTEYGTLDGYNRNNVNYIFNGIAYKVGGLANYIQYGNEFKQLGIKFYKELDIRLSEGDELDTQYITKVNII